MKSLVKFISIAALVSTLGITALAEAQENLSGEWVRKEQRVRGSWSIVERTDGHYLLLDDKFRTRKAPDLKLVLSNLSIEAANGSNALEGGLVVADLQSPRGEQSYKLPENFADYSTLLLHCVEFSKLWGAASLGR